MHTKYIERALYLVFLLYPIRFLTSSTLDNNHLVYSANMERIWVSDGNTETLIAYGFYFLIIILILFHLIRNFSYIQIAALPSLTLFLYSAGILFNIRNWPITELIGIFVFFAILLMSSGFQLSFHVILNLAKLQTLSILLIVMYPLLNFERSFAQCTIDKCTFTGKLFTSFFPHENALALFLFLGSCLYLFEFTKKNIFMFSLHGLVILFTGSRLVLVIFTIITLATLLKAIHIFRLIMIVIFASATLYFTLTNPDSLTGRGLIFTIGRHVFLDSPLFGYGFGGLTSAYADQNLINYKVYHEHNGIGLILLRHGIAGLLGFCLFIIAVKAHFVSKNRVQILLLLAIILTFPTESASDFSIQNYLSWGYIVSFISIQPLKSRSIR